MKAKQPIENFFEDDKFYDDLGDYLRYAFDAEELEHLVDVPDDFTNTFELTDEQPLFQIDLQELQSLLCERYSGRFPEEYDYNMIDESLRNSVDFHKLNSLIPKAWYRNGEFVTVTKQDLINYFE